MSTQLGDIEIRSIEGTTIHGWFRSIYEKNVHQAHNDWGASMLYDAFSSLHGVWLTEADLRRHIRAVEFKTPNSGSTDFTVEVDDPEILKGLEPGAWESYYLG